ncbi:uncharacterized protein LOC125748603 [Brienomyrus brachyistius]|uniref:uncharacterized protein LOC125748603 n=1 Tax=Brienomyrus brachyistius TaxID=42636 RepID=UPI0020B3A482|nr:uncharacterized protein LOC125748603 [Brienomyrus brachyistius]
MGIELLFVVFLSLSLPCLVLPGGSYCAAASKASRFEYGQYGVPFGALQGGAQPPRPLPFQSNYPPVDPLFPGFIPGYRGPDIVRAAPRRQGTFLGAMIQRTTGYPVLGPAAGPLPYNPDLRPVTFELPHWLVPGEVGPGHLASRSYGPPLEQPKDLEYLPLFYRNAFVKTGQIAGMRDPYVPRDVVPGALVFDPSRFPLSHISGPGVLEPAPGSFGQYQSHMTDSQGARGPAAPRRYWSSHPFPALPLPPRYGGAPPTSEQVSEAAVVKDLNRVRNSADQLAHGAPTHLGQLIGDGPLPSRR